MTNNQLQRKIEILQNILVGIPIILILWTIVFVHFADFKDLIPEHKHIVELCEDIPVTAGTGGGSGGSGMASQDGVNWVFAGTAGRTCMEYTTK